MTATTAAAVAVAACNSSTGTGLSLTFPGRRRPHFRSIVRRNSCRPCLGKSIAPAWAGKRHSPLAYHSNATQSRKVSSKRLPVHRRPWSRPQSNATCISTVAAPIQLPSHFTLHRCHHVPHQQNGILDVFLSDRQLVGGVIGGSWK